MSIFELFALPELSMFHPRRVGGGASLFAKVPIAMFRTAALLLSLVAHAECLKPAEAPPRSAVRRHLKPELRPELKPSLVPRSEHELVAAKTEVVQQGQTPAFRCHSFLPGPPGTHGSGRGLLHVLVAAKTEVCLRCPALDPHTAAPSTPSASSMPSAASAASAASVPSVPTAPPCPPRPPHPPLPPGLRTLRAHSMHPPCPPGD